MLRDKLTARMRESGGQADPQRLAEEVLGIKGAPPALAKKLIAQALVLGDRKESWQLAGERICRDAPATPGVYILRDAGGAALYVGKAVNIRRRLRAHFAERRWRALPAALSRVDAAEWMEVGSELEALLREAMLIAELEPAVNVQTGPPALSGREIPPALVRDTIVVLPSIEADSVELIAARADGPAMIQRTRRDGSDLAVHAARLKRFFKVQSSDFRVQNSTERFLAPVVFSWLAFRGQTASRVDPHDAATSKALAGRLAALLRDERLFHERLEQRGCRV